MSREILLELVDNLKEKISSEEYKNLVEEIAKMADTQDYIVSIFYIEYNKNVEGRMVKFDNGVNEMRFKIRQSELSPRFRERFDEYVKSPVYRPTHPQFLIEFLPKIYSRQLYNLLCLEGQYVTPDSDDDDEDDTPIALYKTTSVMFKIFRAEEMVVEE